MSSSAIQSQIIGCQNRINGLNQAIKNISAKISKQENAISAFKPKISAFLFYADSKTTNTQKVIEYLPVSVLSNRYEEKASCDFSDEKLNNYRNRLESIFTHMRSELSANISLKNELEAQLASTNSELGHLNSEYGRVVSEEQTAHAQQQSNKK